MPQMAPLFWLNLFIMFIFIFLMFNTMNYFSIMYKKFNINSNKIYKTIFWKW
uniref:ATP synthase complex subunit 8 n=1 Tax=Curtos bilineatus TaxID=370592 RepID=A0A5C0PYW3_9COLE|nr:ATP synthase F0 subunit 8 [Curtos bilineatus]QEJ81607.1 ATP synthase F0 subunit 8 [Curtos bilineatus]